MKFVFLVLLSFASVIQGLQFFIPYDTTKCVAQEVEAGELIVGDVFVFKESWHPNGESTNAMKINVKVTDPTGVEKEYRQNVQESTRFTFKSERTGDYEVCFENKPAENASRYRDYVSSMKVKVSIHMKVGVEAKDYSNIAKKEHLKPLEVELRKTLDTATSVTKMVEEMKAREEKMRDLNEETNSRVMWFSIMSIAILIALGIWQIYELKKFFIKKKLI
eukprot:comp19607_c0_seq1/m.37500 comp19607_c0_seq1/g.37500  ORF comp19607_c0_seq1/g.37500 comp19607_c0_seq1/m.37500 type:complete len:220 (-) comp19607_c0_seq1:52-711(-)